MARSRRSLPAALVALGLLLAVTQPLPARAAVPASLPRWPTPRWPTR